MQRFYSYFAVFEYGEKSIGVYFPDLPGAISGGDTVDEAAECARECLALHLHGMLEDGDPIPPPSPAERLTVGPSEKLARVDVDLAEFYPDEFGVEANDDEPPVEPKRRGRGGARPGAGRPKTPPEERVGRAANKLLAIRLTEAEFDALNRIAAADGTTKTGVIRAFIRSRQADVAE